MSCPPVCPLGEQKCAGAPDPTCATAMPLEICIPWTGKTYIFHLKNLLVYILNNQKYFFLKKVQLILMETYA